MEGLPNKNISNNSPLVAFFVFTVVSLFFVNPIFENISYWGQMDWDQFTFWHAVPRETILKYHQFPLWNPYSNGGNVLLGHPHSPFLSPFYIFVMIFGPVIGLKLQIIIYLILGMLGMFFACRYLQISKASSYLSSFVYMLSSVFPLHIREGHSVEVLAMAYIPWLFLFILKGSKNKNYCLTATLLFSFIFLGGAIKLLSIAIVLLSIFSVCQSIKEKNIIFIKNLFVIFLGAFFLCAIKLLPVLEFLSHSPRYTDSFQGTPLNLLFTILLNRQQADLYLQSHNNFQVMTNNLGIMEGWHEYGAYIGIIPLFLFLFGAIKKFKKCWPLIIAGLACLLVSLGNKSPINLWGILHYLPYFNFLSCPQRFILGFIFFASLVAAMALSDMEKILKGNKFINKFLLTGVILIVLFDLQIVNSPIFKGTFTIVPLQLKRENYFAQRYVNENFYSFNISRSSMYPVFLSNSGILDSYEVIHVKRGEVLPVSDPLYKGEAYLAKDKGRVSITFFSPNKIIVDVWAEEADTLVLNQNYYNGWKVVKGGLKGKASGFKGLISTSISPGYQRVIFYYMPNSFLIGLFISAFFCLAIFLITLRKIIKAKQIQIIY